MVDLYCERIGTAFSVNAEPLNVWTNLWQLCLGVGFTVYACRRGRDGKRRNDVSAAGGVLFSLVAIGSLVWHMLGYNITYLLDIAIPNLFIIWFAYQWFWRTLRLRQVWPRVLLVVASFAVFAGLLALGDRVPWYPYTSVHWAWWVLLLVFSPIHWAVSRSFRRWAIALATAILAVALIFYAVDKAQHLRLPPSGLRGNGLDKAAVPCEWRVGSHFLWHLTSATGFFLLLLALPPEDHHSPGLELRPCWSCFRTTDFGERSPSLAASCGWLVRWCRCWQRRAVTVVPQPGA